MTTGVVHANRPGAGARIAAVGTARDGATLVLGTTGFARTITPCPRPGSDAAIEVD